ncbi:MAG: hypothetical protein K2J38_04000 [Muribaculaceae bacterium]|nr:hypothetical protein [Muribaculaceae bacterium]
MNFKNIFLSTAVCALSLSMASCSTNDGPDGGQSVIFSNIVTVETVGSTGASFSFQKLDDSPMINLTTTQSVNGTGTNELKKGMRIVLTYTPASGVQYQSGPITAYQWMKTYGEGGQLPVVSASSTENWYTNSVQQVMVQRTGQYLNAGLVTNDTPSECRMVVDEATVNDEYPKVYLIYKSNNIPTSINYVFYASYSMTDLMEHENFKGVDVTYEDSYGKQSVRIDRPNTGLRPQG